MSRLAAGNTLAISARKRSSQAARCLAVPAATTAKTSRCTFATPHFGNTAWYLNALSGSPSSACSCAAGAFAVFSPTAACARSRPTGREGISIVLIEQHVAESLQIFQYAYVLENGEVVPSGPSSELPADGRVRQAYLGL